MSPGFPSVREQRQQSPRHTGSGHDVAWSSVSSFALFFSCSPNLVFQPSWKFRDPINILRSISLRFKTSQGQFLVISSKYPDGWGRGEGKDGSTRQCWGTSQVQACVKTLKWEGRWERAWSGQGTEKKPRRLALVRKVASGEDGCSQGASQEPEQAGIHSRSQKRSSPSLFSGRCDELACPNQMGLYWAAGLQGGAKVFWWGGCHFAVQIIPDCALLRRLSLGLPFPTQWPLSVSVSPLKYRDIHL